MSGLGKGALKAWQVKAAIGTVLAIAGTAHTWWNLRQLREPPTFGRRTGDRVSVLLPLRDEADRVGPCLTALAQQEFDELLILDDGSTDNTADVVRAATRDDRRVRMLVGGDDDPPPGWLGKTWACHRLAEHAVGEVLVFIDADVVLDDAGITRSVAPLRSADLSVVCPYLRQTAVGVLGAARTTAAAMVLAHNAAIADRGVERPPLLECGQRPTPGRRRHRLPSCRWQHAGRARRGVEDVALVAAIKAAGGRGGMADGTTIAACRMYDNDAELISGYTKSLWLAFGTPAGARCSPSPSCSSRMWSRP